MHMLTVVLAATALQLVRGIIDFRQYVNQSRVDTVPNWYIVSLEPGSHLKRGFLTAHAQLYQELDTHGITWETMKEYASPILTGSVVRIDDPADLIKLAEARGIESINPVHIHPPPKPVASYVSNSRKQENLKAGDVPHRMTGVDKLHRLQYNGRGIKVGIIDTGVDYTHPALGGKFGPGYKVIGGHDFVGDGYTGDPKTARPSNDPIDHCNGHGTHVAGIIGANPNNPYGISGVAYQARINAYRIFGCKGGVSDDIIVEALIRAYNDGNDIINLSLGGPGGWSSSMVAVIASRISQAGRIMTIAAGNEGQYGAWYTSTPAVGMGVMSIGSVDNLIIQIQQAVVSNGRNIAYKNSGPLKIPPGLPLYATSSNTNEPADACEPLPAGTPNLSSKLVWGTILPDICTDNEDQPLVDIVNVEHTLALVSQADGRFLINEGIPSRLTISFPDKLMVVRDPNGGLTSNFSTYGPSYDMFFKPSLSAPGGNILSTFPVALGRYATQSGTSMAAPYVAGAAALWLQARGRSTASARGALGAFQNSAKPVLKGVDNYKVLETTAHQGAGLIQVYDAIRATGRIYPAELLLNDTTHFISRHKVLITNMGSRGVTYRISHEPAGTARTIEGIEDIEGPVPLLSNPARVWVSSKRVYVPAGWTVPVTVWFKPPVGMDPKTFPVYSGYIKARGSDNSVLQSSYLGVAASMKTMKVLDNTASLIKDKLPILLKQFKPVKEPVMYTFKNGDIPVLVARLVAGTPVIQVDLIDGSSDVRTNQRRSTEESGDVNANSPFDSLCERRLLSLRHASRGPSGDETFAQVKTVGILASGYHLPRNVRSTPSSPAIPFLLLGFQNFANGSEIPNGSYKILLRALKITGDRIREEDYEVWTSPVFDIRRT